MKVRLLNCETHRISKLCPVIFNVSPQRLHLNLPDKFSSVSSQRNQVPTGSSNNHNHNHNLFQQGILAGPALSLLVLPFSLASFSLSANGFIYMVYRRRADISWLVSSPLRKWRENGGPRKDMVLLPTEGMYVEGMYVASLLNSAKHKLALVKEGKRVYPANQF